MTRRVVPILALLVLTGNCRWFTAPSEGAAVQLVSLFRAPSTVLRDFGILIVESSPRDTAQRFSLSDFVAVQVRTSSGDVEEVGLHRRSCGADGLNDCHALTVAMRQGHVPGQCSPRRR